MLVANAILASEMPSTMMLKYRSDANAIPRLPRSTRGRARTR